MCSELDVARLASKLKGQWEAELRQAKEEAMHGAVGGRDVQPVRKFRSGLMPCPTSQRSRSAATLAERTRKRWPGGTTVSSMPLDQLPSELLEIVARHALASGSAFALASRATMTLAKKLLGIDSIPGLVVQAALTRIALARQPSTALLQRLRFVARAVGAGHTARLFVYPKEASDGPYPSPLREIDYGGAYGSLMLEADVPPRREHVYPMENNMHVTLADPDPAEDAVGVFGLTEIRFWGSHRERLPAAVRQGSALRCVVLHCGGIEFPTSARCWRDHPAWTLSAEVRHRYHMVENVELLAYCDTCCRRMDIQLKLAPRAALGA